LWLGGAISALSMRRSLILAGFDGAYMHDLSSRQFAWRVPLFTASMDWFQGLGDIFFPGNFRLFPSFIAGSLFQDSADAKLALYGVILAELSVAVWLFARALGVSGTTAVAASLITCIVSFPFYGAGLISSLLPLAPQVGSFFACALLIITLFLQVGRHAGTTDVLLTLALLTLLAWMLLANATSLLLAGPLLLLSAISGVLAATGIRERRRKIAVFAAAAAFAVSPGIYIVATVLDTAAAMFPLELVNDRATFPFTSILFHWNTVGPVGPLLMVLAVAGAVVAMFDRSRPTLRMFAFTLVTYLATRLIFGVLVIIFDFWRGPSPLYFEFFVVPLYAVFAAYLFARLLAHFANRLERQPSGSALQLALVAIGVGLAATLAATSPVFDYSFHIPQRSNPFIDLLARESAMQPGSEFRGRTAVMTGQTIEGGISWPPLHNLDAAIWNATGNEMRVAGLHQFGIPGLFQYAPTISPAFYAVTTRLLARPDDGQMRNVSVLRRIEPRILAMLGVRFVITDAPFAGDVTLRATMGFSGGMLFLYEVPRPNVGTYSPTSVLTPRDATEIVGRLASPDFDPARDVMADVPQRPAGLVPAQGAHLTFDGVSLRVQAVSPGQSILLVPLEFSRCLEQQDSGGTPILFRANLLLTGILFSGRLDTRLSIGTGVFYRPWCRLQDYFDARTRGIGDVPVSPAAAHGRS